MKAHYIPHILKFKFDAGTSRGVLKEKKTWFIHIKENGMGEGIGECGPLKGLSVDDVDGFEEYLKIVCSKIEGYDTPKSENECLELAEEIVSINFPSIRFGIETALLDLLNGGKRIIFRNSFVEGKKAIPINGLIWMGDKEFMLHQINQKLKEGYNCLKLKIGSIDFAQECELLNYIRQNYSVNQLTIRVDANGAFSLDSVTQKLEILAKYQLHSIEQPIKPKNWKEMASLVELNILPIALDEELIGINSLGEKEELLDVIKPPYIILKPTLLGGIKSSQEWIKIAEERNIGWWITSALESNVGLNSIAQFTAQYNIEIPQGLGTGQLYINNIDSPLAIEKGKLFYKINK